MRATSAFCFLALSICLAVEIPAQEPDQDYPITQFEQDQQAQQVPRGQKSQRSQNGKRGQKGQGRGGERAANLERLLQRMDRNGDEAISKDELPQRMHARFESLDVNGDGVFDQAEQAAMLERIQEMNRGRNRAKGLGEAPEAAAKDKRRGVNFPRLLEKMDKNADGELTKDELPERMQQRFESLDSNGNGVFDKDEQLVAIERMQQRGDKGGKRKRGGDEQNKQGVKPKRPGGDGKG